MTPPTAATPPCWQPRAAGRGYVDDRGRLGLRQQRHSVLAPEEHAVGVDSHHAAPLRERRLLHIARRADAGVVDETVEAPVRAADLRRRRLPVVLAGDVQ